MSQPAAASNTSKTARSAVRRIFCESTSIDGAAFSSVHSLSNGRRDEAMARKHRSTIRKPATKQPHLRKKLAKTGLIKDRRPVKQG